MDHRPSEEHGGNMFEPLNGVRESGGGGRNAHADCSALVGSIGMPELGTSHLYQLDLVSSPPDRKQIAQEYEEG